MNDRLVDYGTEMLSPYGEVVTIRRGVWQAFYTTESLPGIPHHHFDMFSARHVGGTKPLDAIRLWASSRTDYKGLPPHLVLARWARVHGFTLYVRGERKEL